MTWNLLTDTARHAPAWSERVPVLARHVEALAPTVLATQEGSLVMLADLVGRLPSRYRSVGEGRRGRGADESTAVVYDGDVLTVLDVRHRWLSATPEQPGSAAPDADLPRMLTAVRFHDHDSGSAVTVVATHLDHVGVAARRDGARVVAAETGAGPSVVLGDFNDERGSEAYETLLHAGLVDALAPRDRDEQRRATFVGVPPHEVTDGGQIDWLFVSPDVRVDRAWVDEGPAAFGSDHRPVVADLVLPAPVRP